MYASVVATSTVTASAAAKSWLPSPVDDWLSALPPAASVCCWFRVGLWFDWSLPCEPFGAAAALVGVVLSVSAETVRFCAVIGVAAVLSTNAFDVATTTPTAMPAPDPASVESPFVVTLVFIDDEIVTSPLAAAIELVSESWLVANATSTEAATDESFVVASSQFAESELGAVLLGVSAFLAL